MDKATCEQVLSALDSGVAQVSDVVDSVEDTCSEIRDVVDTPDRDEVKRSEWKRPVPLMEDARLLPFDVVRESPSRYKVYLPFVESLVQMYGAVISLAPGKFPAVRAEGETGPWYSLPVSAISGNRVFLSLYQVPTSGSGPRDPAKWEWAIEKATSVTGMVDSREALLADLSGEEPRQFYRGVFFQSAQLCVDKHTTSAAVSFTMPDGYTFFKSGPRAENGLTVGSVGCRLVQAWAETHGVSMTVYTEDGPVDVPAVRLTRSGGGSLGVQNHGEVASVADDPQEDEDIFFPQPGYGLTGPTGPTGPAGPTGPTGGFVPPPSWLFPGGNIYERACCAGWRPKGHVTGAQLVEGTTEVPGGAVEWRVSPSSADSIIWLVDNRFGGAYKTTGWGATGGLEPGDNFFTCEVVGPSGPTGSWSSLGAGGVKLTVDKSRCLSWYSELLYGSLRSAVVSVAEAHHVPHDTGE